MSKSQLMLAQKAVEWCHALRAWSIGGATAIGVGYGGYHLLNGDGIVGAAVKGAFGSKAKESYDLRGMWGGLMDVGFGDVNADKNAAGYVTQKVSDGVESLTDRFHGGGDAVPAATPAAPPSYPVDYNQYQGMNMGSMTGGLGLGGLVNSLFGGGSQSDGLSILQMLPLLPAAFLLFGNSGFMGKAAGLSIGWLLYQMMHGSQQRQQQLLQQQVRNRQYPVQQLAAGPVNQPLPDPYAVEEPVHRSRGIG